MRIIELLCLWHRALASHLVWHKAGVMSGFVRNVTLEVVTNQSIKPGEISKIQFDIILSPTRFHKMRSHDYRVKEREVADFPEERMRSLGAKWPSGSGNHS